MKIKRYSQFISESNHVNKSLPSYKEVKNYFQSIKDENVIIDIYHLFTNDNCMTILEAEDEFYDIYIDKNFSDVGYDIYFRTNNLPGTSIKEELKHCIENIKIDYPNLPIKYVCCDRTNGVYRLRMSYVKYAVNKLIGESSVYVDNRLPSIDELYSFLQAIKDTQELYIVYSYTAGGVGRINTSNPPENGPPYFTMQNECKMDGYCIYIYSEIENKELESEIDHCIESIKIINSNIFIDYCYEEFLKRYTIYVSYNPDMVKGQINGKKSKMNESSNNTINKWPSEEELKYFFQRLKDDSLDEKWYISTLIKNKNGVFQRRLGVSNSLPKLDDEVFMAYTLVFDFERQITENDISESVNHCMENLNIFYPHLDTDIAIVKNPFRKVLNLNLMLKDKRYTSDDIYKGNIQTD